MYETLRLLNVQTFVQHGATFKLIPIETELIVESIKNNFALLSIDC